MKFFSKIKELILNIFRHEDLVMLPEGKNEEDENIENSNIIKPNIFDIELLQRKFENNIVCLDELSYSQLEMLNDLYKNQIEKLKCIKKDKENQLKEIKDKIQKKKEVS